MICDGIREDRAPVPGAVVRDKNGRQIVAGDILKVYHFTAALRRKKHYMFKQAMGVVYLGKRAPEPFMAFSHLDFTETRYYELCDGKRLTHYEIVQSIDCKFDERPRVAGNLADAHSKNPPEAEHG